MFSASGGPPKTAIIYARVSKEESAKNGYSLAQQSEALREYAVHEGYEVLDAVEDPGYTGISLARPGMDDVRDLVEAGGVGLVLAQDADRITREPAHRALLDEEFARYGCKLMALDDWGDDSHEGQLLKFIKGWIAKGERQKTAERTRRGLLRKVKEGKVIKGPKPNFGFRWNESGDMLVVHAPEMRLVERIFRMSAEENLGPKAIQTRLYNEGIPSPTGKKWWPHRIIKHQLLLNDLYRPHTFDEITPLVTAEVAARLDPNGSYGIWWWNRRAVTKDYDSGARENGTGRYKVPTKTKERDPEDWLAVPVPLEPGLPRDLIDQARLATRSRRGNERKHRTRQWELKNLVRCSCGQNMILNTSRSSPRGPYFYYRCKKAAAYGQEACSQKNIRVEKVEPLVWDFVATMLKEPDRLRCGLEAMLKHEGSMEKPDGEIRRLEKELEERARMRRAYQDQQAAGLMTLDELREKLFGIEEERRALESRLRALRQAGRQAEELTLNWESTLAHLAQLIPEALDELSGDERNALYRMLRLEVTPLPDGLQVTGVLLPSETQSCG